MPSRAFTNRSTAEAMASARSDPLISYSSAACFTSGSPRYRVYTRLRGETRRDHRGLEPKSKRGWEKGENRLRATGDTQGLDPSSQKTRIDTDTERRERINISINKTTNKKLQPTMARGLVTTEQAGEQMTMHVRYNTEREQVKGVAESARAFLRTARASLKPAQKEAMELWKKESRERSVWIRSDSTSSSLRARSPFFLVSLLL